MKKFLISVAALLVAVVVIFGAYKLGTSESQKNNNSTSSSSVSKISNNVSSIQESNSSSSVSKKNPENTNQYDPNKTASGVTVDSAMIQKVTQELNEAGLPADTWAPSDIKSIITQASQQGVSAVTYAKENYHQ
ncbi:hypothetical protein LQZ24_06330 [Fructobacillus sp. M1-13]|uniref:Lipoprotein n=1 Tax=Fructobacillus papyriferae TaxID=2713171 RepID=A0ABS5QPA3_9LACO|nr:hypothetical protein [Fructobacillus papyriferae]MBS9334901.1 hypothetical protein [Fructobacillus papyriferae]MCD2159615.1 hypothetical protein [Fructobacillus papyriferae]